MTEFKGTPAPWQSVFTSIGSKRAVRSSTYYIATLHPPTKYPSQDERYDNDLKIYEADQKLIAAAPELLSNLQSILKRYRDLVNCGDCGFWNPEEEIEVIMAQAAINKALGK